MQAVKLTPGIYIVAVSGGLDSVVLLDMLRREPQLQLVVAHANHGQRANAIADEALVIHYAQQYGLRLEIEHLALAPHCSEEQARQARYAFLQHCSKKHSARGIVTAHHQDDMVETVLMNIMRGTGWRGLAPFATQNNIARPLLTFTKNDLVAYARKHQLVWHEDDTNRDEAYLRNYIRHTLMPLLDQKSTTWYGTLLQQIRKQQQIRNALVAEMAPLVNKKMMLRHTLIMLPVPVAYELLQQLAYVAIGHTLVRPLCEQLLLFAKTGKPGKTMPLGTNWQARLSLHELIVEPSHSW